MAFTIGTTKVLNLPEQVEENVKNIEALNSELDTKQDAGTAVNDGNLKTKIEAEKELYINDLTVGDLYCNTDFTNEGNIVANGTVDIEGKATFGSDAEVDGKLTINSADDLVIKDGSTFGTQSVDDFKKTYYANAFNFRLAGVQINPHSMSSDLVLMFTDLNLATSVVCFMLNFRLTADGVIDTFTFPAFTNGPVIADHCLEGASGFKAVSFSGGTLSYVYSLVASSSVERILTSGTTYITRANGLGAYATNLVEIGAFDLSKSTDLGQFILGAHKVKSIHCTHFRVSFDISPSTAFEESDLVEIIGNLDTVTTPQTLTMGATNLAKLTQDEILVATGKGWTLA